MSWTALGGLSGGFSRQLTEGNPFAVQEFEGKATEACSVLRFTGFRKVSLAEFMKAGD